MTSVMSLENSSFLYFFTLISKEFWGHLQKGQIIWGKILFDMFVAMLVGIATGYGLDVRGIEFR